MGPSPKKRKLLKNNQEVVQEDKKGRKMRSLSLEREE